MKGVHVPHCIVQHLDLCHHYSEVIMILRGSHALTLRACISGVCFTNPASLQSATQSKQTVNILLKLHIRDIDDERFGDSSNRQTESRDETPLRLDPVALTLPTTQLHQPDDHRRGVRQEEAPGN